jgi:prolyl oligopeptidase
MIRNPERRRVIRAGLAALSGASLLPTAMSTTPATTPTPSVEDPYLWLEEVQGEKSLDWVRARNAATRPLLEARPEFAGNRTHLKAILDSSDRIPYSTRRGDFLYNFWRDQQHPRGLWRRTTLAEFRKADPAWDVLLDLDALAKTQNENWVWHGAQLLGGASTRCLISLSRGGADAAVVREFDLATRDFVSGGFELPEAKSQVDWLDENTLLVGTDTGPGSMTDSGYPRTVRLWQRGTPLSASQLIYEAKQADMVATASVDHTPGFERVVLGRMIDFYTNEEALWDRASGKLTPIDKPADARLDFWEKRLLVSLRSDWAVAGHTWPSGALLVTDTAAFLKGERQFTALFTPTASRSLNGYTTTREQVLLNVLDNVAGRAEAWGQDAAGQWVKRDIPAPFPGTLSLASLHDPQVKNDPLGEAFTVSYTDFVTPDSLYLGDTQGMTLEKIKARPAFFDASGLVVEQHFTPSKDGTQVPYFVVRGKDAKLDGSTPTILYGYGGFEVSLNPWYSPGYGTAWFANGGALVVANIRGGGEYGPAWHQAAVKAKKQNCFDDFIAVAQDVIARKISSPQHLGIQGGSNGGLLMGAIITQRPDLFNAVVCQVPLLDMKRYHLLLAGASWMAEYGNPDVPAEWDYIRRYSPYQNVKANAKYPRIFFVTSTRDDRVHPGHARKMAARMIEQGHAVAYYENIEGGHGAAADNAQAADRQALEFSFFAEQLGLQVRASQA